MDEFYSVLQSEKAIVTAAPRFMEPSMESENCKAYPLQ